MGNRSSQPQSPPTLLSAAVRGDAAKFKQLWLNENGRLITDSQNNNVLHALFSCRSTGNDDYIEVFDNIHGTLPEDVLDSLYEAPNMLGCIPLWILVAYGNVSLLRRAKEKHLEADFFRLLLVPNKQGDSCLLATCSQGNLEMVQYLKETLDSEQFTRLVKKANQKGTTPLQIVVANGHLPLLKYLLEECEETVASQLFEVNEAGLSLFHICSERNFKDGLEVLLAHATENGSTNGALEKILALKDKNGANGLHVASFCGNVEAVEVWIETLQMASSPIDLLDTMDGQARTAYWLAMVQGKETIGEMLVRAGVDTKHPRMVEEIEEARRRRKEVAERRRNSNTAVDDNALLSK